MPLARGVTEYRKIARGENEYAAAYLGANRVFRNLIGDFDLDPENVRAKGIVWDPDNERYWVIDDSTNKVYPYDVNGSIINDGIFSLSVSQNFRAIAWSGTHLYTSGKLFGGNYLPYYFQKYTPEGVLVTQKTFASGMTNAVYSGMSWVTGENFYIMRLNLQSVWDLVLFNFPSTGGTHYTFSQNHGSIGGLTLDDDGELWVVYRTFASTPLLLLARIDNIGTGALTLEDIISLDSNNTNPSGLTWDGSFFRVVDDSARKVFTYDHDGIYVG